MQNERLIANIHVAHASVRKCLFIETWRTLYIHATETTLMGILREVMTWMIVA